MPARTLLSLAVLSVGLLATGCQSTQLTETQTMSDSAALTAVVQKFYDQLSDPANPNADALSAEYMADDWLSTPTPGGGTGRAGFVATLGFFGSIIPDLSWDVQEMLVDGNRVTVRSIASGTPNAPDGSFFGVPTDGTKQFEIMTIDIHTVENGKMVRSYHVEEWATAMQQVSAAN
ncbi:MAG: hypothetical protein Rubg2KO_35850 [Rubricoccaceae bacterium]